MTDHHRARWQQQCRVMIQEVNSLRINWSWWVCMLYATISDFGSAIELIVDCSYLTLYHHMVCNCTVMSCGLACIHNNGPIIAVFGLCHTLTWLARVLSWTAGMHMSATVWGWPRDLQLPGQTWRRILYSHDGSLCRYCEPLWISTVWSFSQHFLQFSLVSATSDHSREQVRWENLSLDRFSAK